MPGRAGRGADSGARGHALLGAQGMAVRACSHSGLVARAARLPDRLSTGLDGTGVGLAGTAGDQWGTARGVLRRACCQESGSAVSDSVTRAGEPNAVLGETSVELKSFLLIALRGSGLTVTAS